MTHESYESDTLNKVSRGRCARARPLYLKTCIVTRSHAFLKQPIENAEPAVKVPRPPPLQNQLKRCAKQDGTGTPGVDCTTRTTLDWSDVKYIPGFSIFWGLNWGQQSSRSDHGSPCLCPSMVTTVSASISAYLTSDEDKTMEREKDTISRDTSLL